ncbi:MAG: CRISPR-associated ring nuclease [Verrucomicrobiia bacterium]
MSIAAKNILLCSLGTSWAIVPEAFLFPDVEFSEVHIITTDTDKIELDKIIEFFKREAPEVKLSITQVAGFKDFKTEEDHFKFEEVLYRWMIEKKKSTSSLPYVCLSGGFKTMAAAMQKAAELFGSKLLFHILCNRPNDQQPKEISEIYKAKNNNELVWIRLGSEDGWSQFKNISTQEYPLDIVYEKNGIIKVKATGKSLRERIKEVIERSRRISESFETISELPFTVLATWTKSDLDWLNQPLEYNDYNWVKTLPKIELHCHLGGFATHSELLKKVRNSAEAPDKLPPLIEPQFPKEWNLPSRPISLTDYVKLGDATGSNLLKDRGCLKKQCELLYEHLLNENIVYAEIRCSPANYADPSQKRSSWDVLKDIRETFQDCMNRAKNSNPLRYCHINLILIATRRKDGDYRVGISKHLALAVTSFEHWKNEDECRVVGVDLAGYEDKETRANYYVEEFVPVHRCGIALTVHAGENDDAEAIWRAVFNLNARRLGHSLSLWKSPELMRSIADREIAIEMCPYANYQIKGYSLDIKGSESDKEKFYPLKDYLDSGIKVTVNTDNIGISCASLTDNFMLLSRLNPGITRREILQLIRNAADAAFLPFSKRAKLLGRIEKQIPTPPIS